MIEVRLKKALELYQAETGQKMTYEELASRTGLSKATLESLGSRLDYNATLRTIDRVCDALSCDVSELLYYRPTGKNVD